MENPVPRAGGNRAGYRVAEQQTDSTAPPPEQNLLRLLRRQREIEAVHRLGARVVGELLDEIARHHGIGDDIDSRLARYANIDPRVLWVVGGDHFAALPIHLVNDG